MNEEAIKFDLNADMGEGCGNDERLMPLVTSANVATGFHAGDDSTALVTMMLARRHGVVVGAHPGYPDREHFGRKAMSMGSGSVERLVFEQCSHLVRLGKSIGVEIPYLKPHGALYNQAVIESPVALGLVRAVSRLKMGLLMLPVGEAARLAKTEGVPLIREGFIDRGYASDGTLLPRTVRGGILNDPDEIRQQFVNMIENGCVDSVCIHGDHPGSVESARNVNLWAEEMGWSVRSVWQRVDRR